MIPYSIISVCEAFGSHWRDAEQSNQVVLHEMARLVVVVHGYPFCVIHSYQSSHCLYGTLSTLFVSICREWIDGIREGLAPKQAKDDNVPRARQSPKHMAGSGRNDVEWLELPAFCQTASWAKQE